MNLKSYPIYLKVGSALRRLDVIESVTGRPVIEVKGDPKDCVLDTFESLRDKFAMHAPPMTEQWYKDSGSQHCIEAEAAWKYKYADAMIAESMKGKNES